MPSEISEKFDVTCKSCGGVGIVYTDDDNACGDPDCCGSGSSWVVVRCGTCGIKAEDR